ncbi:hypothetical protein PM082_021617 [Marasmius tenuissimus]|nr:hypothetical protein PM082_021617 [Marasmius tenuissimus]
MSSHHPFIWNRQFTRRPDTPDRNHRHWGADTRRPAAFPTLIVASSQITAPLTFTEPSNTFSITDTFSDPFGSGIPTFTASDRRNDPENTTSIGKKTTLSSGTIGGIAGGVVGLVLIIVVAAVGVRRNRMLNRRRRRRQRQNFEVTALPITAVGPERVVEKTRGPGRPQDVGSPVTDDQRADSELLARFGMIMERAARSWEVDSPRDGQRAMARGTDSEVLAKLDMIMERVARLEDRERAEEEEAPPDYTSNRS